MSTPAYHAEPMRSRLGMTALSLGYALLGVPALVVAVVIGVALPLTPIYVGGLLLLVFVPLNRSLAQLHRRIAGRVLGEEIRPPYHRVGSLSPFRRLAVWRKDPARWRDWFWALSASTIGFVLSMLAVGMFLGILWYLLFPFIFWVSPDGVFDTNYGIIRIDTVQESFLEWIFLALIFVIWWVAIGPVVRLRARLDRSLLQRSRGDLERRVEQVSQSRAQSVDHSAAELRRIERDLHDGAQARLVALGMSLGLAEELMKTDPEAAAKLLEEARNTTTGALGDLRSVVRGIHPPVLADRGLPGAVQALALDLALPVALSVDLPGRAPAPVESAAYFAVVECLANVLKHADASQAWVILVHREGLLRMVVEDDGRGGASIDKGTGLRGVRRRLSAFDGTMEVNSPPGGPTTVTMELPCELSSPRTSPSSATG